MLPSSPASRTLAVLLHRLRTWPVEAQQQARRNAMIAATACAQRRVEREEVDDFLADRYAPPAEPGSEQGSAPAPADHRRPARA